MLLDSRMQQCGRYRNVEKNAVRDALDRKYQMSRNDRVLRVELGRRKERIENGFGSLSMGDNTVVDESARDVGSA